METASRSGTKARGEGPLGYLCLDSVFCAKIEVAYDRAKIKLAGIDLYDPTAANPDDIWKSISPPFTAQATAAALNALKRVAKDGEYDVNLCDKDCKCKLAENWGAWTAPHPIDLTAGFSILAPNPPPPRLRYRANGTVDGKTRMKTGACYQIKIEE